MIWKNKHFDIYKYGIFLCTLLLSAAIFVGCAANANGEDSTNSLPADAPETIPPVTDVELILTGEGGKGAFTIIRPEKADPAVITAASDLWKLIHEKSGSNAVVIKEDWVKEGGPVVSADPEILIGPTNRIESQEAPADLPGYLDFSVTVEGNKVIICANTPERTADAVEYFATQLNFEEDGRVVYKGKSEMISAYDYPLSDMTIGNGGDKLKNAVIVIGSNASGQETNLATKLSLFLAERTGTVPQILRDGDAAPGGAEIVIGSTSRAALPADIGASEYRLKLSGNRLFVFAGENSGYLLAYQKLTEAIEDNQRLQNDFFESYTGTSLDGKNVIFIGNSFIYYGGAVETGAQRQPDKGIFYQICKANGENVTVYDCTYGGHSLSDFTAAGCHYSGCVGKDCYGSDLLRGLDLNSIDYVFISEAGQNNSAIIKDMTAIMDRFPNPETRFFYLCHSYTYFKNHTSILNNLENMRKKDVTIVNWGELAFELAQGKVRPQGSVISYAKNTFIKNKGDTYHPNPLGGYFTAQMAYCAITGKSAVGQDYAFCLDILFGGSVRGYDAYISKHYNSASDTNFKSVFASADEMRALQTLMDEYLEKANP